MILTNKSYASRCLVFLFIKLGIFYLPSIYSEKLLLYIYICIYICNIYIYIYIHTHIWEREKFYIFCFHTLIFLLLYALFIWTFFSPRKHDSQSSNPYLVLLSPQLHSIVIHLESFDHLIMCLFPHLSLQLYALMSYYFPKACRYFHQNVSLRTQASSVPN